MTLISVIVPVYNVENYLTECVNSILNQTFKDFELILIDDGSTDNSGVLCDKFAELDSRVKVIHKKNEKQGAARNCGVRFANSDLISFVDSDDYISSTYLEDLYKVYKNNHSSIICCDYIKGRNGVTFDSQDNSCNLTKVTIDDTEMSNLFKKGNYFWICWCKLIKKEFLLKYKSFLLSLILILDITFKVSLSIINNSCPPKLQKYSCFLFLSIIKSSKI